MLKVLLYLLPFWLVANLYHLLPHLTRFWNTFKNIVKIIAKRIYSLCFSININANLLSCPRGACRVEKWHEVPKILFSWQGPPPPDSTLSSETFPATDTPKELFKRSFYSNQCARQLNEVRSFQVFYDEVFLILGKEDFGNLLSLLIFYLRNLNLNWQQLQWKELSKSYTVVTTNEGDELSVLWWWGAWLCRHRHVKRNTQQNRQQAKNIKVTCKSCKLCDVPLQQEPEVMCTQLSLLPLSLTVSLLSAKRHFLFAEVSVHTKKQELRNISHNQTLVRLFVLEPLAVGFAFPFPMVFFFPVSR